MQEQQGFTAELAKEIANNYIERGELSNIITQISNAAKEGKFHILIERSLFQDTINNLRALGYKVEETTEHFKCAINVSIYWS